MSKLLTVTGVCVLTLLFLDVTFALLRQCSWPPRVNYPTVCATEPESLPVPKTCNYTVSPVSNDVVRKWCYLVLLL